MYVIHINIIAIVCIKMYFNVTIINGINQSIALLTFVQHFLGIRFRLSHGTAILPKLTNPLQFVPTDRYLVVDKDDESIFNYVDSLIENNFFRLNVKLFIGYCLMPM